MDRILKEKDIKTGIRVIVLFLCMISLARGMKDNYTYIKALAGDEFQTFLSESVDREDEFAGEAAYIELNVPEYPTYWTQCNMLLGELEGDYKCKNGGVAGFLEEEQAVLYVSGDIYELWKDNLKDCQILYENEQWMLLRKQ